MRMPRPGRPPSGRRLLSVLLRRSPLARLVLPVLLCAAAAPAARAADRVAGLVVDGTGQPLPRALVRVLDGAGLEAASAFSDERGRFDLPAPASGCRVEAALDGFSPASAACAPSPARVVLAVAPVRETVVVSATRTEAPADQVGASVTTFTAEDLARRRTPLVADLLRSTPGAMIVKSGGDGSVTSLFVRGGESTYNKVLVDGVPINEPGGTFFFNNLTTENLDRIEIVRGAQSALFGSDAMASVVQLFTKRGAPGPPRAGATLEGGSYGTLRATGSVSGRGGPVDYAVGAARFSTDNRVPNSAFENNSVSASVGAAFGANATLRFVGRGEFGRNGTPGQTAFGRADLDAFAKRNEGLGSIAFDQQITPSVRHRASYALAVSHQQSTNLVADPPYTPRFENRTAPFAFSDFLYDSRTQLRRHHASYQADIRLANDATAGSQLVTVLADWDGERASLQDLRAQTASGPARDNVGVSIQHQAIWRRVVVGTSGRIEHNASFGSAAVPRGSVVLVAREGAGAVGATRIRVAAGLGIKEPTLLQSFSPSPFFRGNPDLEPERSTSYEVGVDQRLGFDRAKIAVAWFHNRYRNLISTRTTNPQTFEAQFFNIGLTRARGAEFSVELAPAAAWRARAGYTLLDSTIIESTSPASAVLTPGKALFRRPRHSGFAELSWNRGRIGASLNGVFIGRFVDSDFSSLVPALLDNPGYATWDARVSFTATRRLTALLSIDNLLDADYMEPLGYQALRRAMRGGLRIGF